MPPRTPHIAAAARGSRRWWRSNWRRRAGRSGSRTAARRRSVRPEWVDPARRPRRGPALYLFDHDAVDLVGDVVEAVGDLLEVVVDLDADDEIHGIGAAVLEIEFLHADVVEVVDAAFQLAELFRDRRQHRDIVADRLQKRQRLLHQAGAFEDRKSTRL